jgi:pimeloyl-ACP methyl ester carboxylesterase
MAPNDGSAGSRPGPQRPGPMTVMGEGGWPLEWARLGRRGRALAGQPRGHGEPVRVFPGMGAGDASTAALRRYLRRLGYDARGWELGRNNGEVARLAVQALALVADDRRRSGQPVHLIGWSLGGVIAREVARERPDLVAQVITFGSPIVGGPRFTSLARLFPRERVRDIETRIAERNARPITVPITAIHSRRDGVVGWEACIDTVSPRAVNVEVQSTHLGMGIDPDIWHIVAQSLAGPQGRPA